MKRRSGLKNKVFNTVITVIVSSSAWDWLKKVCSGFNNGQVVLDTTSISDLGIFLFYDWFWLILIVYGLILLIPFIYKKIQHANAESQRRMSEKRKQEFREVLQEKHLKV